MTIFLVILAILIVGATAVLASGRPLPAPLRRLRLAGADAASLRPGAPGSDDRGPAAAPTPSDGLGLVEPVASLPPVLLPAAPSAEDVERVRFGLGLRGYRMDQVDEVLDLLAAALEQRDAVIADLRSQLVARGTGR